MNDDDDSILLPVYSPTYPPENTSVTTSMPPNKLQKPSEAQGAKGIARLTVHISSSFRQKMPYNVGVPSRWSTAEFKFYYVVAFLVIPVMIWIPMSLSLRNFSFLCYGLEGILNPGPQLHIETTIVTPKNCRKAGFTTDLW